MVERSTTERIANYEEIAEKTLPNNSQEQMLSNEEMTAQHLKFTIKSGYDHFIGVSSVEVMGSLASGRSPTTISRKPARYLLSALFSHFRPFQRVLFVRNTSIQKQCCIFEVYLLEILRILKG